MYGEFSCTLHQSNLVNAIFYPQHSISTLLFTNCLEFDLKENFLPLNSHTNTVISNTCQTAYTDCTLQDRPKKPDKSLIWGYRIFGMSSESLYYYKINYTALIYKQLACTANFLRQYTTARWTPAQDTSLRRWWTKH